MRRTVEAGCCARAASGHVAAAPPRSAMNSRRLNWSNCIRSPARQGRIAGYRIGEDQSGGNDGHSKATPADWTRNLHQPTLGQSSVLPWTIALGCRIADGRGSPAFPESPPWPSKRLRCFPEVSDLCIEGALEGGPGRAAVDIGGEALVAGDDVGVLEDSQHRRHHEIASREAVAVKIGLVAERFG